MALKLIQLNIQMGYHYDKWIPFIQREKPDVLCVQEIFEKDMDMIRSKLGMDGKIFLTSNKTANSVTNMKKAYADSQMEPGGPEGVAIFTNLPGEIKGYYYIGDGTVPEFDIQANKDRVLTHATVEKDGKEYKIATTHFTWTPNGLPDDKQREAAVKLLEFDFTDFILCGDFNFPRGNEIYDKIVEHFKDEIPPEVDSTLDPRIHRVKDLKLVVDFIFTKPCYEVKDIKLVEGLSDHKAIVALINRK